MNRVGTALFAAVEAVIAVAAGFGIALVPFALLWGFEYKLQMPWSVFWQGASSVWLIGHGVDVTFVLDAAAAKATGIAGAGAPISVSLAALGFAVITAWIGARAGRRFAETEHRITGVVVATVVVAVLSAGIALGATSTGVRPVLWQAIVAPALWFGVPAVIGAEIARRRRGLRPDPLTARVLEALDRAPAAWRAAAGVALRTGTGAMAVVIAVAGVLVALAVLSSYAEIITLYERSHADVVGGMAITVGELAFVPDFVGWATAWIVGPGFAFGTGSNVSAIQTVLGPIPAVPVLGALPVSGHAFGFLWVLVPVVAGFVLASLLRPRLREALGAEDTILARVIVGAGSGIVAGAIAGVVAALSSGSFGPGRLADVGPSPWPVAGLAALEVGVPAILALVVSGDLVRVPSATTSASVASSVSAVRERVAERVAAVRDHGLQDSDRADLPERAERAEDGERADDTGLWVDPRTGPHGGFPWRTEEFVEADRDRSVGRGDEPADVVPAPARQWEAETVELPDDDVPWWKRPKSDA